MRQEHPLLSQPQLHLTELSKNKTPKPFMQESIGNSSRSICSDVAPAAISHTKGSTCLVSVKGKHDALTSWHIVDGCDSLLSPTAFLQACARAEDSSHQGHDEKEIFIKRDEQHALEELELQGITACHSGICQCGDPTRLGDVEESEEDEDEDEKELQAQWLQVLTSADVRLGAKSTTTYAHILARNGLSPSRINNAAADEKHPLLQSMKSPFDKAVNRLNLIEGLARAAQPTPNS